MNTLKDQLQRATDLGLSVGIIGNRFEVNCGASTWYLNTISELNAFVGGAAYMKRKGEQNLQKLIRDHEAEKAVEPTDA